MPQIPFPIDGVVKDIDNSLMSGATIEIHNLRNGFVLKKDNATDSNGVYIIDLRNFSDFKWVSDDRVIIRAYRSGAIFKSGERHALLSGDALENQDITLFAENPPTAKDLDDRKFQQAEHHPTANAKKIILVDEEGHLTTVAALDERWDYDGTARVVYIGEASAGSKDGDMAWRIKKRFYTDNKFTKSLYADKGRFTNKWNERKSINYE